MEKPSRIPLFPLDVVLLPAMTLPLHIFEPRYKIMIARCISESIEFGIVLASDKTVARVGCTAKIVRTLKDHPDRRMDILTEGHDVFHIIEVLDEKAYYEGRIEYLADEPLAVDARQEARVTELFRQCHALLFDQAWVDEDPKDSANLAYWMAARLPMELQQRQALLETRQENKRRESLLQWLATFVPKLVERRKGRQRAEGNGHGLN
jgi:Lon protease-like protein